MGVFTWLCSCTYLRVSADGEQRVVLRPIRTKLESTACCVPHTPRREVSAIETLYVYFIWGIGNLKIQSSRSRWNGVTDPVPKVTLTVATPRYIVRKCPQSRENCFFNHYQSIAVHSWT